MLHGYQFESGKISLVRDNSGYGTLYDIGDETAALQRQELLVQGKDAKRQTDAMTRAKGATMSPPAYQTLPAESIDINSWRGKSLRVSTQATGMLGGRSREAYKNWKKDQNRGIVTR